MPIACACAAICWAISAASAAAAACAAASWRGRGWIWGQQAATPQGQHVHQWFQGAGSPTHVMQLALQGSCCASAQAGKMRLALCAGMRPACLRPSMGSLYTHLPPDVACRCCAGEGRQGHGVQPVLLSHLIQEVAQVVVLNNEPAETGAYGAQT